MTATTLQISSAACDARFLPETIDVDKRTVEVVASTGARVLRGGGWFGGEPFWEELRVDKSAIRLERLNSGRAPVLDSHMAWRLGNVLGVVVRAWIANGELHALLRMSGRNAEMQEHWTGIREGTLANISLIYRVHEFVELDERGERDFKVRQAADWEPLSVDFVPIGADAGAGSRAEQETNACLIRGLGDSNQEPETMPTRTEEANTETPAEQAPETARTENTETPPAPTPQPTPTRTDTAPAPSSESAPAERAQTPEEVLRADRERRAAIRRACEAIGVQRSVSDELEERVEGGRPISADRARTILF